MFESEDLGLGLAEHKGDTFESTVWWPIPGHREYELGDAFEIRHLHRYGEGRHRKVPITYTADGRPRVAFSPFTPHLSHVVASVIHGPKPADCEVVRHLDDDVTNTYPSNLAYGTQADNIADSLRNGTFPIGERNGRSKLNADDVREIRRRGGDPSVLAAEFGVTRRAIVKVLEYETWRHIA